MSNQIYALLDKIELNELVVPEFQREYRWRLAQSQSLIHSLYKEFPTGSLLFWTTPDPPALKNEEVNKARARIM
jgi:uncharacterized protein with ParB-like and HNH nuclease domain